MRIYPSSKNGSVLAAVVVMVGLISLTLLAYLSLSSSQHSYSMRSQNWNGALVMAESGVEEALTQANYAGMTNIISNGWAVSGTNVTKTRNLGNGYYTVTISTSSPPLITSQGYVQAPLVANSYISRTVQVSTLSTNSFKGLIAQTSISMSGSALVDSFDSTGPNPTYYASNATANAYVAVISGAAKALRATKIYGNVATGPGGTVKVSAGVGDAAWVNSSPKTVEPGHIRNDVNLSMTAVPVPDTSGWYTTLPAGGKVNGTNYTYIIANGNYFISGSVVVSGGESILVTGNVKLYTSGSFTISGSGFARFSTGATLDLYCGGPDATLSGGGNDSSSAFHLYGLPGCTTVTVSGGGMFLGVIYAPSAALTFSGGAGAAGSAAAKTITLSGSAQFHCDTSLYGVASGALFTVASWNEL